MPISPILLMGIAAWAAAQVLKFLISIALFHKVDIMYLTTGGGMPSSHSALVCSVATAIGLSEGFTSPLFALAATMAFIVMYDAMNVRHETGEQSKVLNYMMKNLSDLPSDLIDRDLKELLGHTPSQVTVGALLGTAIGVIGTLLTR